MDQSVREAYESTWGRRRDPPIVTHSWVNNDWAKGRTDYLTFLIRIDYNSISSEVAKLQDILTVHSCLDPFPSKYLHVTVKEVACFLVDSDPEDDELTKDQLDKMIVLADITLKDINSFEIQLKQINHFRSNIVVEAHDDGSVREINKRLMELEGVKKLTYDYPRFLPHMSICQFKTAEGHDEMVDTLEKIRNKSIGRFNVTQIDLVKAILPKKGRYPVLETLHSFRLE